MAPSFFFLRIERDRASAFLASEVFGAEWGALDANVLENPQDLAVGRLNIDLSACTATVNKL